MESDLYKMSTNTLKDPRLDGHLQFKKLVARLKAFYVLAEKYRQVG